MSSDPGLSPGCGDPQLAHAGADTVGSLIVGDVPGLEPDARLRVRDRRLVQRVSHEQFNRHAVLCGRWRKEAPVPVDEIRCAAHRCRRRIDQALAFNLDTLQRDAPLYAVGKIVVELMQLHARAG